MRVAIYLRVSTSDQTTDNQRRELEAVAKRYSWSVVRVFEDAGISGAKGRDARPGLDALMKGVSRRDFDILLINLRRLRDCSGRTAIAATAGAGTRAAQNFEAP
jgi:DNA invertase Pin-like site-specific DNA recombinase